MKEMEKNRDIYTARRVQGDTKGATFFLLWVGTLGGESCETHNSHVCEKCIL